MIKLYGKLYSLTIQSDSMLVKLFFTGSAYCSFIFLIVIIARRPLKLDMIATSFDIPATICLLVFYCVSFFPPFRLLFNSRWRIPTSRLLFNLKMADFYVISISQIGSNRKHVGMKK